jgi:hypothetical protein
VYTAFFCAWQQMDAEAQEQRKRSRGFLRNDARLREELGKVVIRASDLREGEEAAVELTLKLDREGARANQVKPSR